MTTVAELTTRVTGLKTEVDKASGALQVAEKKLTTAQTDSEGKAASAKPCPDQSTAYKDRAEAAKPKVKAIPGIDDIAKELHNYAVPEPDFCLPLISNLDLERGAGTVTFTRSTTATYVDKSGVLRTADVNKPRFEKDGILIEGSSTNLLTNSTDLRLWSGNGKYFKQYVKGPDGSNNALKITGDPSSSTETSNGIADWGSNAYEAGALYTLSFWARSDKEGTQVTTGGGLKTSSDKQSTDTHVISCTREWKRYSLQRYSKSTGTLGFRFYVRINDSVEIFGPQLEKLPFASSYIPTTDSPVTRNPETIQIAPSTLIPFKTPVTVSVKAVSWSEGDTETGLWALQNSGKFAVLGRPSDGGFKLQTGGVSDKFLLSKETMVTCRVADRSAVFLDGKLYGNDRTNSTPTGDSYCLTIGGYGSSWPLWGHLRNFRIWRTALTDDQVAML